MIQFNLEGNGSEDETTLWSLSSEYLEAAIVLNTVPASKQNFSIVTYYLVGHAAELTLKSYLYKNGVPKKTIKNIGHDLSDLINKSMVYGLKNFSSIRELSPIYNGKELEYRRMKGTIFPPIDTLINETKQLQSNVFDFIVSL